MNEIRIKFSRHAKRRMILYGISESTIQAIIERQIKIGWGSEGKVEVVDYEVISWHGYPIKVVFSCEGNNITIVTAYPLKRGKNEDNL
jgi:hypothetical protein